MISALMISCLLLCGCGRSKEKRMEEACERLACGQEIALTAQVQANFGETVESYTLDCSYDGEDWRILVTAPQAVAGIAARIGEHASEVEYEGAILSTGALLRRGISPIGAVPMVYEAVSGGVLDSVWEESQLLAGAFSYDDALGATVWFDEENTLVAGELTENGIVKAVCRFENVQIKETEHGTEEKTNLGGDSSGESGT